ncbi:hypothetical protein BGX38DRAFT_473624 [Terfezia claveryi]|nr:hypothetical protein BGX38DRAFT_473624 [Terfezia claveryi]
MARQGYDVLTLLRSGIPLHALVGPPKAEYNWHDDSSLVASDADDESLVESDAGDESFLERVAGDESFLESDADDVGAHGDYREANEDDDSNSTGLSGDEEASNLASEEASNRQTCEDTDAWMDKLSSIRGQDDSCQPSLYSTTNISPPGGSALKPFDRGLLWLSLTIIPRLPVPRVNTAPGPTTSVFRSLIAASKAYADLLGLVTVAMSAAAMSSTGIVGGRLPGRGAAKAIPQPLCATVGCCHRDDTGAVLSDAHLIYDDPSYNAFLNYLCAKLAPNGTQSHWGGEKHVVGQFNCPCGCGVVCWQNGNGAELGLHVRVGIVVEMT